MSKIFVIVWSLNVWYIGVTGGIPEVRMPDDAMITRNRSAITRLKGKL